ncbi:MAG: GH3 auxin-responsive promoter family protein [Crocinitomicaceae bacterium]
MIVGPILKGASQMAHKQSIKKKERQQDVLQIQTKVLRELLYHSAITEFGIDYKFSDILKSANTVESFSEKVPIFQYDFMHKKYWHKSLSGVPDVSWPGRIQNFALTSGTTNSASKKIPVSNQMIKSIRKNCLNQINSLSELKLPASFYEKDVLCVGGSTDLAQVNSQFEGDLSGILTGKVPSWLNPFTKPSKKIRAINDWDEKLERIVDMAPKWDVGIICGVPSWVQILINKILERYKLQSIFEIWPNIRIYIHGGVAFQPYLNSFNQLFKEHVIYLDTYLASEGFIGFQGATSTQLQLQINNGIYFEFMPFDERNFDSDGNLKEFNKALNISEIEEGVDYAILITTNSGAFRYLIGDTIKFTDVESLSFKITGRTKHFLSLCGEHLSVDNMTDAISQLSYEQNISIDEFAVIGGVNESGNFYHKWFIASDHPINAVNFKYALDERLADLNEDYKVERQFALNQMDIEILPPKVFYDFLKVIDKYGSQHKFPRILKGKLAEDWKNYIAIIEEQNAKTMVNWQNGN